MSETTVRVPLTVEERAERADMMAGLLAEIAAIERQKAEKAKELGDAIKALEARLQEHGNVLREGAEERAQKDLTFPEEEAARALHDIGAAACSCEGGPEADVKSAACPVHGVDSRGKNPAVDEQGAIPVEGGGDGGAEVEADYVVPPDAQVDVGTVAEPPAVANFREAKARRRRA